MGFLQNIFSGLANSNRRRTSHAENVEAIESYGFKVEDLRGWYEGKYQPRRYHLVDAEGKVWDNDGVGFQSTKAALKAAKALAAGDNSIAETFVAR